MTLYHFTKITLTLVYSHYLLLFIKRKLWICHGNKMLRVCRL